MRFCQFRKDYKDEEEQEGHVWKMQEWEEAKQKEQTTDFILLYFFICGIKKYILQS